MFTRWQEYRDRRKNLIEKTRGEGYEEAKAKRLAEVKEHIVLFQARGKNKNNIIWICRRLIPVDGFFIPVPIRF